MHLNAETIKAIKFGDNSWIVNLILWGQIYLRYYSTHWAKLEMLMFTTKQITTALGVSSVAWARKRKYILFADLSGSRMDHALGMCVAPSNTRRRDMIYLCINNIGEDGLG